MDDVLNLIGWLGRQAGIKAAESYVLPPKVTPRSRTFKTRPSTSGRLGKHLDEPGRSSQTPHRYGVTKRPEPEPEAE